MIECSSELRRLGASAASFEQATGRMVRHLYDNLHAGEGGERATTLVRAFRALPYSRLDGERQELARIALGREEPDASTLCLLLVATAGDRREWNSARSSVRHRVIPLPKAGRWSPMVARLVRDLGVDTRQARDPALFVDLLERTCNVFHVAEARNSPYVPDQEEFVQRYDIASVLGFGGIVAPMDLYVMILFSKVPVPRGGANLFRAVSHSVRRVLQPFAAGTSGTGRAAHSSPAAG
jgi:hypothetical protein